MTSGDGYGTGWVVYVVRRAGLPVSDARLKNGIAWIKTHQWASGRWFTPSLYRDVEHDLTNAGTAYACMALHACGQAPVKCRCLRRVTARHQRRERIHL